MKYPTHPARWQLVQHIHKGQVRAHEFAEGQAVSLLEIDGLGQATLRALYATRVDAADKVLTMPTDELLEKLAAYGIPVGDTQRRRATIERWKGQISALSEQRKNQRLSPE